MDFPDADELEWLESNSFDERFEEDFEIEFEPPSPPSSPEPRQDPNPPPERPILSLPPRPSPFKTHQKINVSDKKRSRSNLPESPLCLNGLCQDGKRSRFGNEEVVKDKSVLSKLPDVGLLEGGPETVVDEGRDENVNSVDDGGREGDDEWLRYSPPQVEEVAVLEEERGERILSRYATEIEGDCMPVTGLDGERVYAKLCRTEMGMEEKSNKLSLRQERDGLLQEPVRVLMQKVEQDEFTNALRASVEVSTEVISSKAPVATEKLWVDKYAPNSFTELLSAEQTNREVLLWLKQWDSCVFGSEITSTTEDVFSALRRHSSGSRHHKQSTNYHESKREPRLERDTVRNHNEPSKEDNFPQRIYEIQDKRCKGYGPSEQKILLLCGPPGLGKTTLAHVAAKHCGYRVVEINASDDRSSAAIEAKILDVVQMNSVIADSKPKCLIIDEIDGALNDGKGAVEVILRLVSAEQKRDTGKENVVKEGHSMRKSSQKKKNSTSLLRPVICICNDLYAPALRPLRQVAKVHIFVKPTATRVVNRLKYICNKEGLKTSSVALTALAEYTECDIRSCLNTLQFLNQKKEILNVLEIGSQVVGRKDVSKSAFDVWKEILHKKKEKRSQKSNYSVNNITTDFDFLYSLVSNRGDYELILDGIHENILLLRYIDPVMQKTVKCLDNLLVSDVNHRYIMRTQQMSLQVYQPPIAISIHSLVAQLEKLEIQWPKSFQRHRTISAERMDIFYTWNNRMSPYISRHLSMKSFTEDSVSPMLHILSPPTLRPVALHLLSEKERSDLGQLVNVMVSYFITYKNIKSDRSGASRHEDAIGASELFCDPPLSKFINFKGYCPGHFDLAIAVKQVLVHEVEKQKILQGATTKSIHLYAQETSSFKNNSSGSGQSSKSCYTTRSVEKKIIGEGPTPSKQSDLSISSNSFKSMERTKKCSGDLNSFFDRFRKTNNKGSQVSENMVKKPGPMERDSRPILFKFNEGFTNAVKRPVRMREFLP